jgi:cell division transport system permease protein
VKSIKNHLSLVIALVSILFSLQVLVITERSLEAYKEQLSTQYSVIAVSKKSLTQEQLLAIDSLLKSSQELSPDEVIKRLDSGMSKKNIELLKLTLPKFYKLKLKHYPTPVEIDNLTKNLLSDKNIIKVENFAHTHDLTYKLLLLFKTIIVIFTVAVFIVTSLLILKELKIWQFKHSERMNIMGLFGAPVWLRSAVLFRLAVMDAVIATFVTFGIFVYLSTNSWLLSQFNSLNIDVVIFNPINDFSVFLAMKQVAL